MAWNGRVILSSVLILYLCLCFRICGFSNCTDSPGINFVDSEGAFDLKGIISSKEILKNGASITFASGAKVATCARKRKFLRRRLLYSSNGSQSFNPVIIQIILSSKSKILGLDKIPKKIIQPGPWMANMQIRASRLLI